MKNAKRILMLAQGLPGAGKSTTFEALGLSEYVVSTDAIRLLYTAKEMTPTGFGISQKRNKDTFKMLNTIVEDRLRNGVFTIVDATHATLKEVEKYKKMAKDNRFKVVIVKFEVSLEEAIRRNQNRGFRGVPKHALERIDSQIKTFKAPNWVEVIDSTELETYLTVQPFDLSKYRKIWHIGDIHGCYDVLKDAVGDIYSRDFYIFHGDYVDRGIQNVEVLEFLMKIQDRENVVLLKGNHELHLENYSKDRKHTGRDFDATLKEIEASNLGKKEIRVFTRRLRDVFVYKYNEKLVICSHGGVPELPKMPSLITGLQYVKGVGDYKTDIDEIFTIKAPENTYQFHGHRNLKNYPINSTNNSFNLEGKVEFGKNLRIVKLSSEGFEFCEYKNSIFKLPDEKRMLASVKEMVEVFREDQDVKEKKFGNISSFNFSESVFFDASWNSKNSKARGLFINTETNKIVNRGYEKFFNINELPETELEAIKDLKYPLVAYLKENGYLGMIGYDEETDSLVFSSKSTINQEHANYIEELFNKQLSKQKRKAFKEFLKENNVSATFEVIKTTNGHIIEYNTDELILLDFVYRIPVFKKMEYKEACKIALNFGFKIKEKVKTIKSYKDFVEFYNQFSQYDYKYNGNYIEGFVFEDANGYMFKAKLAYYIFWKQMRTLKDNMHRHENLKSVYKYIGSKVNKTIKPEQIELAKEFSKFMYEGNYNKTSIIDIRNVYFNQ